MIKNKNSCQIVVLYSFINFIFDDYFDDYYCVVNPSTSVACRQVVTVHHFVLSGPAPAGDRPGPPASKVEGDVGPAGVPCARRCPPPGVLQHPAGALPRPHHPQAVDARDPRQGQAAGRGGPGLQPAPPLREAGLHHARVLRLLHSAAVGPVQNRWLSIWVFCSRV